MASLDDTVAPYDLGGKVMLVTGSTDGIGRHTASRLAACGARVLLHGRDKERLQAAKEMVERAAAAGGKGGSVGATFLGDLADLGSTRALGQSVVEWVEREAGGKLDGVSQNAGLFYIEGGRRETRDGMEETFQTNVAALFVLNAMWLPLLNAAGLASGDARLVNVASISHLDGGGILPLDNLQMRDCEYNGYHAYGFSKLAVVCLTYEMAARGLLGPGTHACTCDPGTVNTKMLLAGWGPCGIRVGDANDQLWMLGSPGLKGPWTAEDTPPYYVGRQARRSAPQTYDADARSKLWTELERLTGVIY